MVAPKAKSLEVLDLLESCIKEARLIVHDVLGAAINIHFYHQLAASLGAFEDEVSAIGRQRPISCFVDEELVVLICNEKNSFRHPTRNGALHKDYTARRRFIPAFRLTMATASKL